MLLFAHWYAQADPQAKLRPELVVVKAESGRSESRVPFDLSMAATHKPIPNFQRMPLNDRVSCIRWQFCRI